MKLKEVCEKTGLSRKTIRLYEEKGLIDPKKETVNGRDYREYTEIDVQKLKMIALLRRAWFTMEEIKQMEKEPESIEEIFQGYRQWLGQQKRQLEELIAAADKVDISQVENIVDLTERMAVAASRLPLPKSDIRPRFKYIDEIEKEVPAMPMKNKRIKENWEAPLDEGVSDSRLYRQFVASSSKNKADDMAVNLGFYNDTAQEVREGYKGPVQDRDTEREPGYLRFLKGLLTAVAVLFGIACFVPVVSNVISPKILWPTFLISAVLRILLSYLEYRRKQQAWINRVNDQK